ncbi:MAG: GH36 C-terminal domain-containing protein, partial [Lachnospiraceae bacterium]|nr:GH36 C-terminal domain-containing protein [Lachnospiraceae bacterium]
ENRGLIQSGDFYRLISPFEDNYCSWMIVSEDKKKAVFAYYRILSEPNSAHRKVRLKGLDRDRLYHFDGSEYYGSELMEIGVEITEAPGIEWKAPSGDFMSGVFVIE